MRVKCWTCKKRKHVVCFYKSSYRKSGIRGDCKTCAIKSRKKYISKNKEKIHEARKKYVFEQYKKLFDYLKDKNCIDCGFSNPVCLDFDHVRGIKNFDVSDRVSFKSKLKEIGKCEVRCANCHRIKTSREKNSVMYNLFYGDEV